MESEEGPSHDGEGLSYKEALGKLGNMGNIGNVILMDQVARMFSTSGARQRRLVDNATVSNLTQKQILKALETNNELLRVNNKWNSSVT